MSGKVVGECPECGGRLIEVGTFGTMGKTLVIHKCEVCGFRDDIESEA